MDEIAVDGTINYADDNSANLMLVSITYMGHAHELDASFKGRIACIISSRSKIELSPQRGAKPYF